MFASFFFYGACLSCVFVFLLYINVFISVVVGMCVCVCKHLLFMAI